MPAAPYLLAQAAIELIVGTLWPGNRLIHVPPAFFQIARSLAKSSWLFKPLVCHSGLDPESIPCSVRLKNTGSWIADQVRNDNC